MKKTITVSALLLSAFLFSCKKEAPVQQDDFAINASIDQKLSPDNVVNLSKDQLTELARQKYEVLVRIKANHPGITFETLYPNLKMAVAAREIDCQGQFNTARNNCNYAYLVSSFWSVAEGAIIGTLMPPVGAVVGGSGVVKATFGYALCMKNANDALKNCK